MTTTGFPESVRAIVLARSGGLCERCGNRHSRIEYHHRRPRKMGGTLRPETNAVSACLLLCAPCHYVTESNRTEAYENGWLMHDYPTVTPPTVPVRRRGQLVLLADDGSVTPLPSTGAWGETPGLGEGLDDVWPLGEYPEVVL